MFKNSIVLGNRQEVNRKDAKQLLSSLQPIDSKSDFPIRVILEVTVPLLEGAVIFQRKEDNIPIAFKVGRNAPIPTLYFLWCYGSNLPGIYVNEYVSEYILNGANLMLPGILTMAKYQNLSFPSGSLVVIYVSGNPSPIAIGVSDMSSEDIYTSKLGTKGKAVSILHFFGDGLWQLGSREIPAGFSFSKVIPIPPQSIAPTVVPEEISESVEPPNEISMDFVIYQSFLYLCQSLSPDDLPMNASSLLSRIQASAKLLLLNKSFVKKNDLNGIAKIDLKFSSYKKFSNLILFFENTKLIVTKLVYKELIVFAINFDHEKIKTYSGPKFISEEIVQSQLLVTIWYILNPKWEGAFPEWIKKGSKGEMSRGLSEYLKSFPGEFVTDEKISKLVSSKTKKDIMLKFTESLLPMYSLSTELPPRARRGDPPKIVVHAKRIQGNKFCTNVSGLESGYKLNESEVASKIAKQFALTANSSIEGGVYCQGNLADKLELFLIEEIGIPKIFIQVKKPQKK